MKYLSKEPMFFGYARGTGVKQSSERGGPAMVISKKDRCPSGRHNRRLTDCYCEAPATAERAHAEPIG